MLAALQEQKKDHVVIIAMPPPQEVKENIVCAYPCPIPIISNSHQPWDTGVGLANWQPSDPRILSPSMLVKIP
jgi:hypothetical protein